jgi:hypothetical protein
LNIAVYDTETTLSIAPRKEQVVSMRTRNNDIDYDRCPNSAGFALSPTPGEIRAARMDDVIPNNEIVSFECDAQGADLNVCTRVIGPE